MIKLNKRKRSLPFMELVVIIDILGCIFLHGCYKELLEQLQCISDSANMTLMHGLFSPGGHEGGHVQLQREGNISGDLPPQFG